ncbi:unannotated protein [freshwater metagenome]|uniref:Unannotated protein n=1 Tax=freshwater metagenome TaxID=449393 RepID=A0A6J7ATQ4_9ZZZZ
MGDERGTQVETSAHATRVRAHRSVGSIGEAELVEQLSRTSAGDRFGQVVETPDEHEVLPAGEILVDRCELTGEADTAAYGLLLMHHVESVDQAFSAGRLQHRGQHAHHRGFSGAVHPEQAEHRATWHRE